MNVMGFFIAYFSLLLIGFGPSLLFFRQVYSPGICFSVWSPLVGLVLLTLVSSSLVLAEFPVFLWQKYALILGAVESLLIVLYCLKCPVAVPVYTLDKKQTVYFVVGGIVVLLLLILPPMLGGENFVFLRGNGADAINYMGMAETWNYLPRLDNLHQYQMDSMDMLKNPVYDVGMKTFYDRGWTVSVLMALFSDWSEVLLYRFEYLFSLIFLASMYAPAFLLSLKLNIRPLVSAFLASSISAGFWAIHILENRSQSHLSVLPLLLGLMLLLFNIGNKERGQNRKEVLLFALLSNTVLILYPEITPVIALGFLFLLGSEIFKRTKFVRPLLGYYLPSCFFSIIILFWQEPIRNMLIGQIGYAAHTSNNWDQAIFPWLYHNFLSGAWNMLLLGGISRILSEGVSLVLMILSLVTVYFAFFRSWDVRIALAVRGIAGIAVSGLLIFAYLFVGQQWWAAGKILTYICPFIMFLPVIAVFGIPTLWTRRVKVKFFAAMFVFVWLISQWVFSAIRIDHALTGTEYSAEYASQFNSEYRRHNWDFELIEKMVFQQCSVLGLDVKHTGIYYYVNMIFGGRIPVVDVSSENEHKRYPFHSPDCLLIESSSSFFSPSRVWLANNNELFLLKITKDETIPISFKEKR